MKLLKPPPVDAVGGSFVVFISESPRPQLCLLALFRRSLLQVEQFMATIGFMPVPLLDQLIFFVSSPAFALITRSPSIADTITLFETATGWKRATPFN